MPDDLYDQDSLAWSLQQATLLRRHAAGERVNGIDWDHVVEEIEDVGLSQLNAVRSYLELILLHLLKLRGWPEESACRHWRHEIVTFQVRARARFSPSMRQKIDLAALYRDAVQDAGGLDYDIPPAALPPSACPVTLDALLSASCREMEAAFRATDASMGPQAPGT